MRQDSNIDSEQDDKHPSSAETDLQERAAVDRTLEDYRQRYGLSFDPFAADPYFPFFTGGQRRELLDRVLHLCQFGSAMPVVMGGRGVGKTRLALALAEAVGSGTFYINALPTVDSQQLLGQIAEHFDISPNNAEVQELISSFREADSDSSLPLVLIDDAHNLDDATLKLVCTLMQAKEEAGAGPQLVLFGDVSLASRLHNVAGAAVSVSDFHVEPFSLNETVDYLNFRMEIADYLGPEIFTATHVEPWWRSAHGRLTNIHRSAREHLLEAVLPTLPNRSRPFPIIHIVAIAVLGGAVLMTLLYQNEQSEEASVVQRVPINLQQPVVEQVYPVIPADPVVHTEEPLAEPDATAVAGSSESSDSDQEPEASTRISSEEPAAVKNTVALESSGAQASSEPPPDGASGAAGGPNLAESTSQLGYNRSDRVIPLSTDEETLLSWAQSDFTLQLLGVSTEKAAKEFIAAQPNRDNLLMFRTIRHGKDWFVVVAGRYSSAAEARKAIADLPPQQGKAGPWPRAIETIHQEVMQSSKKY